MKYRPDIDGLRAIAVGAVVLYHAGLTSFGGGFVGVDIFFVISGYLISSILINDLNSGGISIIRFYVRRIRRIFPAFYFIVLTSGAVAWMTMLPGEFTRFGESVIAASLFVSNLYFFTESGYFDALAQSKPLLHTWSLAVEEQFYIVFPFFLKFLKCDRKTRILVLAACAVFLFALCARETAINQKMAFYMAPFRGWEFLMGALIADKAIPLPRSRVLIEFLAVAASGLLIWSIVTFSDQTPFPGFAAFAPCLGAAALIYTGTQAPTMVGRLLGSPLPRGLGLISYSLYLWHWPIFVFAGVRGVAIGSPHSTAGLIALALLLSALSWRFVEQPFRRHDPAGGVRAPFLAGWLVSAAVVCFGLVVVGTNGVPTRFSPQVRQVEQARLDSSPDRGKCHASRANPIAFSDKCRYGAPSVEPSLAIWGDSFAVELAIPLGEKARSLGKSILFVSYSGCPPTIGVFASSTPDCEAHNLNILENLARGGAMETVILIADHRSHFARFGAAYLEGLARVADSLAEAGKKVVVNWPIPAPPGDVPTLLARRALAGLDPAGLEIDEAAFNAENREVLMFLDRLVRRPNVSGARPGDYLCVDGRCRTVANGRVLYFDGSHLSLQGAALAADAFRGAFER